MTTASDLMTRPRNGLKMPANAAKCPVSADLTTAAGYGGFLLVATATGAGALTGMGDLLTGLLAGSDRLADAIFSQALPRPWLGGIMSQAALQALPWIAGPAALALLSIIGQRAMIFAPEKLAPKLSRISPMTTLGNKFGCCGPGRVRQVACSSSAFTACCLAGSCRASYQKLMETMQLSPALAGAAILRLTLDLAADRCRHRCGPRCGRPVLAAHEFPATQQD